MSIRLNLEEEQQKREDKGRGGFVCFNLNFIKIQLQGQGWRGMWEIRETLWVEEEEEQRWRWMEHGSTPWLSLHIFFEIGTNVNVPYLILTWLILTWWYLTISLPNQFNIGNWKVMRPFVSWRKPIDSKTGWTLGIEIQFLHFYKASQFVRSGSVCLYWNQNLLSFKMFGICESVFVSASCKLQLR